MSYLILAIFLGLAVLGMPLAFALGSAALAALLFMGIDVNMLPQRMMHSVNSFPLMAIPFFMLAGELMLKAGIMERLVEFANAFIGRVRGGLAHVTLLSGAGLATVSGTAVADASALSATLVPALEKSYGRGFATAIVAAAANLGPIIPPSAAMIVYAYMAGSTVSVGGLFLAGVVPGLLIAGGMMAICSIIAHRRNYPLTGEAISLRNIFFQLKRSLIVFLMPVVVLGGIIGGAFTATEGAAIAVVYALFIGFFITRKLRLSDLPALFVRAAITTAVVGALIAFASAVTFLFTVDLLPQQLAEALRALTDNRLVFNLIVAVMLFVVGMFMESNAAYIMLVPLFHPLAISFGIDPLHFAFLFVLNLVIGMLTPPVGVVLFVVCGITHVKMRELMRHVWPFVALMYGVLIACMLFPPLVTALPHWAGY
ncbi:MAG: TRAP transporter large permease [Betaproteobacteria bacterium]|nr:MAG: TRAP transporter large permease [Betaproteobacteria bacterium]